MGNREKNRGIIQKSAEIHAASLKTLVVTLTLVFSILNCDFAQAKTVSGHAEAQIVEAAFMSEVRPLNIQKESMAGNQITQNHSAGSAHFKLSGGENTNISISFTQGHIQNAGHVLRVQNFSHTAGKTPMFNRHGVLDFQVAADLVSQKPSSRAAMETYSVTINYQ